MSLSDYPGTDNFGNSKRANNKRNETAKAKWRAPAIEWCGKNEIDDLVNQVTASQNSHCDSRAHFFLTFQFLVNDDSGWQMMKDRLRRSKLPCQRLRNDKQIGSAHRAELFAITLIRSAFRTEHTYSTNLVCCECLTAAKHVQQFSHATLKQ